MVISPEQEITQETSLTQWDRLDGSSSIPRLVFNPTRRLFTHFHMMIIKK